LTKKNVEKVSDLIGTEASYNPRVVTSEKLATLDKTLREYGDLSGIVLNVRTNTIVGGHQRKKVLDPGWTIEKVPVTDKTGTVASGFVNTPYGKLTYREVDWDEYKEKAANLAANTSAGIWDDHKKRDLFEELNNSSYDLMLTGHSADDIENIFSSEKSHTDYIDSMIGNPKEKHHKLQESETFNGENDHSLAVVKVNLTVSQTKWLDQYYQDVGLKSRSEAVRHIVEQYIRGAN